MKNIFKTAVFILLMCNCFALTAQTKKEMLTGTWVFDFEKAIHSMDEKAKTILIKIPSAQRDLENNYRNRKMIFSSNGNFSLILGNGRQTTGTWTLDGTSENTIIITLSDKIGNLDIILLSPDSLIVKLRNESKGKPIFSQWYFTKI